jgi:hypothetical protein
MNRQVEIKAEQIARMIVAGLRATRIAEQMNLSYAGLQRILQCQEYIDIETRVRRENLGKMDAALDERAQLKNELDDAVPDALRVLVDQVKIKRDLRAALEVLDRDPKRTFAKGGQQIIQAPNGASIPQSVLDTAVRESERTREILIRVPQAKPAEA